MATIVAQMNQTHLADKIFVNIIKKMRVTTMMQSKKTTNKKIYFISYVLENPHLNGIIGRTKIKPKINEDKILQIEVSRPTQSCIFN